MATKDSEGIGQRLRHLRTARNWSVRDLATRTGLSHSTVSRWESGKFLPSIPELEGALSVLEATSQERRALLDAITAPRALHRLREQEGVGVPVGGDLLRAMRLRQGATQAEVARATGSTQGQVARWERSEAWPDNARLQKLCWFLAAQPEEVSALTAGTFRYAPVTSEGSVPAGEDRAEWEAAVDHALRDTSCPIIDLRFLSLESRLWDMREKNGFALPLLSVAYAHHARMHLFHDRSMPAGFWAGRSLELVRTPSVAGESVHTAGWGASVVAAGSALAYSGGVGRLKSAIGLVERWLPAVGEEQFRAWILSELASYHARLGMADAAIAINRNAITISGEDALHRRRDHARLLVSLGRYAEALSALNEARSLRTTDDSAFIRHHLLEAECFLGLESPGEVAVSLSLAEARLDVAPIPNLMSRMVSLREQMNR